MPPLSRLGYNPDSAGPMGAGDWGRQAMPMMQPTFTPTNQIARAPVFSLNEDWKKSLAATNPDRPYGDVGKMALNLADPRAMAPNAPRAQGLIEGFGAGAGRLIGGFVGQGQAGADIGEFVGHLGQMPLDLGANVLGSLPASPLLPGGSGMTGKSLLNASDEERKRFFDEHWDGNPMSFMKALGEADKEDWQKQIDSGSVSPIFRSLGPSQTMGDQVMNILGMAGIPSDLLQRGYAGGPGEAIKRVNEAKPDDIGPELVKARDDFAAGKISRDRFLDLITVNQRGYSDNWALNFLGSAVLDPANLAFGAGAAMGLATKGAKVAQAFEFADRLGAEASTELARSVTERTLAETGKVLAEDAVTPMQKLQEAQRLGKYGTEIADAAKNIPAHQQVALHPAWAKMEKVADISNGILNPFNNIGVRGTKPIENAFLSRESTKGIAQAYGLDNYSIVSDRLAALGKGELFDKGVGYYGAQEGLLLAGDNLKSDVEHIRRVSSARPTDVALARARVGAENYAFQIERWVGKRKADLAMLTGGTKEEAMARAQAHASDRLTRMGLSAEEAAGVIKGLDEDGLSLIDAMYFGHRIETYNLAKRAARETLSSAVASNKGGVATKAQEALQTLIDRATLIGPRELTFERAQALRAALKAGDIKAVRDAVRKYDRLAYQFLADGGEDQTLISGVRNWLDEMESGLTHELDPDAAAKLPKEMLDDATRGDGYVYGLRPAEGADEWRLTFHEADDLEKGIVAGTIKNANPWMDIVGDAAEPWNLRMRDTGSRYASFANLLERKTRAMGAQITTDRIDREVRRRFVERAMLRHPSASPTGAVAETGMTYGESRALYNAVKTRALEASVAPRGLNLEEFKQIIEGAAGDGARRVGMSERDLMMLTLTSFEGNMGTVGLTQKLSGKIKVAGADAPFMPANMVGQMAERMYPLIRFAYNPFFQLQEWVEPWVFSAARGKRAMLTGGWDYFDPVTGTTRHIGLDDVDLIQNHMIERYRASNPESQFDMMERSLAYLHGQKAAKEAAAATDQNVLRRALSTASKQSAGDRKKAASSEMFRYFLGPMLKAQFDKINPNIWLDLERQFGTKDMGTIAVRWITEKDRWASADPRVAYHLMDTMKEPAMGARSAVNLEENAQRVFRTSREALNTRVMAGHANPLDEAALTYHEFVDTMRETGAHQDYIDRTWKVMQFEAKTGGVDQWWDDAAQIAAGGAKEIGAVRTVVRALAEVEGISETELLSRTLQHSPVSLLHDDLLSATADDLAAWGTLLQQGGDAATYYSVDAVTGAVSRNTMWKPMADMDFLKAAQSPPQDIPLDQVGRVSEMKAVTFGAGGRDVFIPGGLDALRDLETPFTTWEAHVIRAQMVDPNELLDPALKHALYEKMWRSHEIDMADPGNVFRLFNNSVMAMLSSGLNLTRNELISTRFRVGSMDELAGLAAETRSLRATIEATLPEGERASHGDLGLAYSTNHDVAHYIPLDDRLRYMRDSMLPARQTLDRATGKMVDEPGTQAKIEERASAASGYLQRTTKEQRATHAKLNELQDGADRLQHWAVDEMADAIFRNGVEGIEQLNPLFGVKRLAAFKDDEITKITEAAGRLAEDPLDLEARSVLLPYVSRMKKMDDTIIFKPWNVNGAGLPATKNIDGSVITHGDKDLFAYLKNDDVAWRGFSTNVSMGRALSMAEDMSDNPQHFVRRTYQPVEPARFGTDARGNATVPRQFQSEEGFVYRTVNGSRALSDWRVGEYAARHPATIYAQPGGDSVVLRTRRAGTDWEDAVGGVDASKNVRAKTAVTADQVEMLGADGTWHPVLSTPGGLEPLDEFAERMSHRTDGLSLKTSYFGVDLGDPRNFERGVMDTHMVGDLTEHMYYDLGKKGTSAEWHAFYDALSPEKQREIDGWIAKGAKRGAGVYDWSEASGIPITFKAGKGSEKAALDAAVAAGDHGTVASWMRDRVAKLVANPKAKFTQQEADRLLKMYPTDEGLAELYGREVTVLGADYRVYDDVMTARKAAESVADPTLTRHGNGGYQWKLWDDRRKVWDPESSAFAAAHTLPRRSVRYMASSDDAHFAAGFMDKGGLRPVTEAGYSYLDPARTIMAQKDGRLIRGATITTELGDRLIGLTQYRNRSTFLHEITHAVLEPMLTDKSYAHVVWDDLNSVITERNATLISRTTELKAQLDDAIEAVVEHQNALAEAKAKVATAGADVATARNALTKVEAEAKRLTDAVTMQQGVLKQLKKDAPAKRVAASARKYASEQKRGLESVEATLKREQDKLDGLIASRDEATTKIAPARLAHTGAREAHVSAKAEAQVVQTNLRARTAEEAAINGEYTKVATQMPEQIKYGWDNDVSEHFADEFAKWLATGTAKNPKMRDAFAYFRNVLVRIFEWTKGQPRAKVSPEMQQLFEDLTTPAVKERMGMANAVPFDASEEMMHASAIQSVTDAEDAAFTNVQFRRKRSWLERSINHPYLGIYPASYMWGKVAPEIVRALAVNPFGMPIPFLTKPVRLNGIPGLQKVATKMGKTLPEGEYGLHGSPFMGFVNAQRAQNAVELQKDTDPQFSAQMNDPKNQQIFTNLNMFMPATPWDIPANFSLWQRRIAEYGLEAQDAAARGEEVPSFDVAKLGKDTLMYAYGPAATADWLSKTAKIVDSPMFSGAPTTGAGGLSPAGLEITPAGAVPIQTRLSNASTQLQQTLGK